MTTTPELNAAAMLLYNSFEKDGETKWEYMGVASRKLVDSLRARVAELEKEKDTWVYTKNQRELYEENQRLKLLEQDRTAECQKILEDWKSCNITTPERIEFMKNFANNLLAAANCKERVK